MVTNWDETIKMPINEPAPGKRKSQIQVCLPMGRARGMREKIPNVRGWGGDSKLIFEDIENVPESR